MRLCSLIICTLTLLFLMESRASADPVPVPKPKDQIFYVQSREPGSRVVSLGSGFATKRNGKMVIVTATHVVNINEKRQARVSGINYPVSIIVSFSVWEGDVCFAEIESLPDGWAWINSGPIPSKGEICGAWGFPHGNRILFGSSGIVSDRKVVPLVETMPSESHYLSVDGIVIEGMSGGPVVDKNGNVFGIISHKRSTEWFVALLPPIPH